MVKVFSNGKMESSIKENSLMIKEKDMESSHGEMDVSMMANGEPANNMEEASSSKMRVKQKLEFGKMAVILNG